MINLEIVTPEKKVVDEEVEAVNIPTAKGMIGILINHAPLISTLKPGILSYKKKGSTINLFISGGFVEVSDDKVSVLADASEKSGEIDAGSARDEREKAYHALSEWKGSEEKFEAELERLEKAQARLELASKN